MSNYCSNCIFRQGREDEYSGMADCRRYPPTQQRNHYSGGTTPVWIKTGRHDWCGEHRSEK